MILAGAVNGVPATLDVIEGTDKTLDISDNGVASTVDVKTDGADWDTGGVSSRVAIIGGTTSGRDHFPFPVADEDTGFDDGGAFVASLEQMCKWFYLVKTWRVAAYCKLDQDASPGNFVIIDVTHDFSLPDLTSESVPLINEYDLIATPQYYYATHDPMDDSLLRVYLSPFVTNFREPDEFLFPFLVHYYSTAAEMTIQNVNRDLEEGGPAPDTTATGVVDFDGSIADGYVFVGGARTLVECHINVTPVEFWPYADKNGDPVYNTSTGAQLTDPLG